LELKKNIERFIKMGEYVDDDWPDVLLYEMDHSSYFDSWKFNGIITPQKFIQWRKFYDLNQIMIEE